MTPEESFLLCALLAVFLPFVVAAILAPIRTRTTFWYIVDSGFEPCKSHSLPHDVGKIVAVLEDLGFINLGNCQFDGFSVASARLILMENPHTLDVAKVLIAKSGRTRQVSTVFQSRFEDGTEIASTNAQVASGLPSPPEISAVWLPAVQDPRLLYNIHSQVIGAQISAKKKVSIGPEPIEYLNEGRIRLLTHWVENSFFYLDASCNVYRPTWKGAILITWRHRLPLGPLYRRWRLRETHELLRDLGIHQDHN